MNVAPENAGQSPRLLSALELFIAVMALGGGVWGLARGDTLPREWLEGSPFESYAMPSLILLIAVAGSMASLRRVSCCGPTVLGRPPSRPASSCSPGSVRRS